MEVNDEVNSGTTGSQSQVCPDCRNLKFLILKQLEAFKVLTSMNATLSSDIIIQNIQGLLAKHDETHNGTVDFPQAPPPVTPLVTPMTQQIVRSGLKINDDSHLEQMDTDTMDEPALQPSPTNSTPPVSQKRGRPKSKKDKDCPPKMSKNWTEKCLDLLATLLIREDATPFKKEASLSITQNDPFAIPMSLNTIEENVQSGKYTGPREFHKDMMLIFHNARLHHIDMNSPIRIKARSLENFYEWSVHTQNILESTEKQLPPKPAVLTVATVATDNREKCLASSTKLNKVRGYTMVCCPRCSKTMRKNLVWSHQRKCGRVDNKMASQNLNPVQSKTRRLRFLKIGPKSSHIYTNSKSNSTVETSLKQNESKNVGPVEPSNLQKPSKSSRSSLKKCVSTNGDGGNQIVGDENIPNSHPDLDVHLFVQNFYPKFNLIHALTAKVEIERLHPRQILTARKKIKNSVPGYKPSKWGRKNCSSKKRRLAIMKMDRISGLYNSKKFLTKGKPTFVFPSNKNSTKKKKKCKPIAVTLTFSSSTNNNFNKFRDFDELEPMKNEEDLMNVDTPPVTVVTDMVTNGNNNEDNSTLLISSDEAADLGLNPFDCVQEGDEAGQLYFDPSSEMMVGQVVVDCHGDDDQFESSVDEAVAAYVGTEVDQQGETQLVGGNEPFQNSLADSHEKIDQLDQSKTVAENRSSLNDSFETFVLPISTADGAKEMEMLKKICPFFDNPDDDDFINQVLLTNMKENGDQDKMAGGVTEKEEPKDATVKVNKGMSQINEKVAHGPMVHKEGNRNDQSEANQKDKMKDDPNLTKDAAQVTMVTVHGPSAVEKKKFGHKVLAKRLVQAKRRRDRVKCLDCPVDFGDIRELWSHQSVCQAALIREKAEAEVREALRLEAIRLEEEKKNMKIYG